MKIAIANFLASKSLSANNKSRLLRKICRNLVYLISRVEHSHQPAQIAGIIDREPWPFCDSQFCPWEEDDSANHYTLFPNPAGFVVGHSTAYVSAMIALVTGKYPKVRDIARCHQCQRDEAQAYWVDCPHKFDAKNWVSFLIINGYRVIDSPDPSYYCVGVNPQAGEFGLVVWFEQLTRGDSSIVSTRVDRKFQVRTANNRNYTWIRICNRK